MTSSFDFVTGEEFRSSLEADFAEMKSARESAAWKSVHVLAGSIVEAVLIDYLMSADGLKNPPKKPLELDLNGAITLCRDEGIISAKSATLSDVVRDYRNLIHPGRSIRLAESVDESSATVAMALVDMILRDVGKSRADALGYTAEQLVTKVESDPSAIPILKHMLGDMTDGERRRLLIAVLPARCLTDIRLGEASEIPVTRGALFRATYDMVPAEVQRQATEAFVKVLREEPEPIVAVYETAFWRGADLKHLTKAKQGLVKTHALARLKSGRSAAMFEAMKGVSPFLTAAELSQTVDAIMAEIVYGQTAVADVAARELLSDIWRNQGEKADELLVKRLGDWVRFVREKRHERTATVTQLAVLYGFQEESDTDTDLDDLPF